MTFDGSWGRERERGGREGGRIYLVGEGGEGGGEEEEGDNQRGRERKEVGDIQCGEGGEVGGDSGGGKEMEKKAFSGEEGGERSEKRETYKAKGEK